MSKTTPTWTTESDYCPLTGDRPERACEKCKGTGESFRFEPELSSVPDLYESTITREYMKCWHCSGFGTLRGDYV